MNMEEDKWIELIENSCNGLTKVSPRDAMFLKISEHITKEKIISNKMMWVAAASIVLFFSFNLLLVKLNLEKKEKPLSILIQEIDKDNQLYQ